MGKGKILVLVGTRPEAVKMAPVIKALRSRPNLEARICSTGQHREMLCQTLGDFGIAPDLNLDVMAPSQSLASLSSRLFDRLDEALIKEIPDWVLIQGDTTTVMVAAMCAFYRNIRIGHVEAGLRSFNNRSPFPEEINRKITALMADAHFAPTEDARDNLLREGVPAEKILLTGNTVVDALLERLNALPAITDADARLGDAVAAGKKIVLVTAHRRENHGQPLANICSAIATAAKANPDACFIYPVHLNPQVREKAFGLLAGKENIILTEPLPYAMLLTVMHNSHFILTDSGGIQEEACVLKKPVLVLRDTTERQEGVKAGAALLLGSDRAKIIENISLLLHDREMWTRMSHAAGLLYGDGNAASRIADYLETACRA